MKQARRLEPIHSGAQRPHNAGAAATETTSKPKLGVPAVKKPVKMPHME